MTLYEALAVLELTVPVSHDDIRKAFRNKAKLFHPDKYTDPLLQESASRRFIAARKASEFLLSFPAEQINTGRIHSPQKPPVQARRRHPSPPPPALEAPLVKELDNIARLFGVQGRGGNRRRKFSFSPVEWLGQGYMLMVEKVYPGEQRLKGLVYAFFRFVRLFFGVTLLIVVFFTLSVAGVLLVVVTGPPALTFLLFYRAYSRFVSLVTGIELKEHKTGHPPLWRQIPVRYLMARTLPVVSALLVMELLLLLTPGVNVFLLALCIALAFAFLLLGLSIAYEWLIFFRMKKDQ